MTNDEIRRNAEIRMTKPAIAQLRAFRHSSFGSLSSFVIRHSTTCANQVQGLNPCENEKLFHVEAKDPTADRLDGSTLRTPFHARLCFFAVGLLVSAIMSPAA